MPPGAEGGRRQGVGGKFFRKENECSISSVNCYEVRGHSHNARGRGGEVGRIQYSMGKKSFQIYVLLCKFC